MNKEHWITHDQLDTPINEVFPEAENDQTMREFIRESEEEFGMKPRNLDELDHDALNIYIDWVDELWFK